MASIENIDSNEIVILHTYHMFGRNKDVCNTCIYGDAISRSHATIHWARPYWYIQDHSKNGTWINGRLIHQWTIKLKVGSHLQFGNMHCSPWEVLDLKAPADYLRSLTIKNHFLFLHTCHALPNDRQPLVSFYKSVNKKWIAETNERAIVLTHGTRVQVDGEQWEFIENSISSETQDFGQVKHNAYLKFNLSPTEEDIRLKLVADGLEYDIGRRSYNYLLLALARKRLKDRSQGFGTDDQGWFSTERLKKEVGKELAREIDEYYLNLQIYRLRKHFVEMQQFGNLFSHIIERRKGELRIAFPQLKIYKDNSCIGEIME